MKEALSSSETSVLTRATWRTSQKTTFFIVTAVKTSNLTQITLMNKHRNTHTYTEHGSSVDHQTIPLIFVIQKKAFSDITVSHLELTVALFSFPVANDKGVATTLDTGCPQQRHGMGSQDHSPFTGFTLISSGF
jgi:hypothetical protein